MPKFYKTEDGYFIEENGKRTQVTLTEYNRRLYGKESIKEDVKPQSVKPAIEESPAPEPFGDFRDPGLPPVKRTTEKKPVSPKSKSKRGRKPKTKG